MDEAKQEKANSQEGKPLDEEDELLGEEEQDKGEVKDGTSELEKKLKAAEEEAARDTLTIATADEPPSMTTNQHNAIAGNYMNTMTHNGLFLNGAWILYGVAFLIHPVWPESWAYADPVKMRRGARIGGCLCILVGLLTRFGV